MNRIARTNGLCNKRCIKKRNFGRQRIANITSAIANMDMMIILIIAVIGAVFVSIGRYILQLENGANISILHLYVAAFVFAVIITLMTVPLWPIASIMQWTGKRERQRLDDIERQTHKKGLKKDPSLDISDNSAD